MAAWPGSRPEAISPSRTRPVISGQVGSSIALWSAKGTALSDCQLLSTSNAAQPPSLDCIASSQVRARCTQASCPLDARVRLNASRTWAVSSISGYHSLANSKYQPEGGTLGRFTLQSPRRRTSLASSQSAERVKAPAGASFDSPKANAAIAVSQTTEKQGWK